jgi:hypothetical protein
VDDSIKEQLVEADLRVARGSVSAKVNLSSLADDEDGDHDHDDDDDDDDDE